MMMLEIEKLADDETFDLSNAVIIWNGGCGTAKTSSANTGC